jgi:ATP-dependent helicase/nuclease subunit B
VLEAQPSRPRLFTIPPSAPFLTTLARAVLAGDLPIPGGVPPDPLALPRVTLYLPTRRAARAVREAFLAAAGGRATLLPRIRALGDPDEDAALILGTEAGAEHDFEGAAGAPDIGTLQRRLALMRLILAWGRTRQTAEINHPSGLVSVPLVATPAQASYLAADLARLMDFIESEEVNLAAIEGLVPDEYAEHWQLTLDFLDIVTERWPQHLRDHGLVSPVARRNLLMAMEAERLRSQAPAGAVIAAGSTGTVPATARLLSVIASRPNGAVVLPGLDLSLDAASWKSLGEHPEHPQFALAKLLATLGVEREEVVLIAGSATDAGMRARLTLVSEVMRPSHHTDRWRDFLDNDGARRQLDAATKRTTPNWESALAGISLVEAPTALDEAEAIALILRSCIETPDKTAALITPDRALARRVAAALRRFNLPIDDSAGVPMTRTVPGAFLDLVLGAVESNFAPAALMALLKHPLTLLERPPSEMWQAARGLELLAFRHVYAGQGLAGVAEALKSPRERKLRGRTLAEGQKSPATKLVADLVAAFAPLTALFGKATPLTVRQLAEAHIATAEALARAAGGSASGLWQGDAGEAFSLLFTELMTQGEALRIEPPDYAPFWRSLLAGQVVRPRGRAHPRLFIWGPLEARLQQPDVVILGGLNEGVWPQPQEAGPWLSRPMREKLGLPPPERRNGLAAHDFAQGLGAPTVYLTRALKVDGVPTVPSRWLQRLLALVEAAGARHVLEPALPYVEWAKARDAVPDLAPAKRPAPCPPPKARPRKLSVTRIERMLANPYEIFARDILKLYRLDPLGAEPDAAMRGRIMHQALHQFVLRHPEGLPAEIEAELVGIADGLFAELGGSPRVEAFWRPHFQRFARWFAATEPARRDGVVKVHAEVDGNLKLDVDQGFELTARADRIDVAADGSVLIYDYKTGAAPSQKQVDALFAPQLPLEAAIAAGGAFGDLGPRTVSGLRYVEASGRRDGGEERAAATGSPVALGETALKALIKLIERFDQPDTPYEVKRRAGTAFARAYRFDDYAHLARVKEWQAASGDGDDQ